MTLAARLRLRAKFARKSADVFVQIRALADAIESLGADAMTLARYADAVDEATCYASNSLQGTRALVAELVKRADK